MQRHPDQGKSDAEETDDRFPSGPWTGFWLQRSFPTRQWMSNFWLRFASGKVEGAGSDIVGDFAIRGHYDTESGSCLLYKDYLGLHTVTYQGKNESDGKWLWGLWTLPAGDRGGFHIWPQGVNDPTTPRLHVELDLPAESLVGASS